MVRFLLETEQSYVQSLRTVIKVSMDDIQIATLTSLEVFLNGFDIFCKCSWVYDYFPPFFVD